METTDLYVPIGKTVVATQVPPEHVDALNAAHVAAGRVGAPIKAGDFVTLNSQGQAHVIPAGVFEQHYATLEDDAPQSDSFMATLDAFAHAALELLLDRIPGHHASSSSSSSAEPSSDAPPAPAPSADPNDKAS